VSPARLVAAFEELHAAVVAALIAEPVEIPGHLRVIVLPSQRDLDALTGSRSIAGLFHVSAIGEPMVLIVAGDVDDLPQVVAHELAHHVSYHLFPRQHRWFSEGLAQFVEGVAKVDREGRRWAGSDPIGGWVAGSARLTPATSLFAWDADFPYDTRYVTSWVLYRFLWNERSEQLSDYQRRLSEGAAPNDAWDAAFPEWRRAGGKLRLLDEPLWTHQRRGRGLRWQVQMPDVDRAFTTSVASSADVHMGLLEFGGGRMHPAAWNRHQRDIVAEVLREDSTHASAIAKQAQLDGTSALSALRASVAARSGDGAGWFHLAEATKDSAEREAALRKAVSLWPEAALPRAMLAIHLARDGRAREALPIANRAVDLAPWHPGAITSLATVALELGKCREGLLLQARAADVADAGSRDVGRFGGEQMRRQLAAFRERCKRSDLPDLPDPE
jgi:hypothetical protein